MKKEMDLYSDYLLSSFGPVTATGLSALLDNALSHDKITRMLSGDMYTSVDLWQEVKGINLLTAFYHTQAPTAAESLRVPVAFECVKKTVRFCEVKTRKEKRQSPVTKNEMMRTMLTNAVKSQRLKFRYILANSWFASSDNMLFIHRLNLNLSAEDFRTLYKKRWSVEEYHKSLKQNTSLAKSPTRTVTTQTNHLFASLLAYIKLERLKFVHKLNHFALKGKIYFNALKRAWWETSVIL